MKILYLFKRLIFRLKTDGLKRTFKDILYFNRSMVVIEKEISSDPIKKTNNIHFIIVDKSNYKQYQKEHNLENIKYYCKQGAKCVMAFKEDKCLGYQWWTQDNKCKDLKKIGVRLKDNEAYLFDLFVFPEFRGTKIPKMIAQETFNCLSSMAVDKIYGYYFADNVKALWWHKAILKCTEINRVKIHRLFFFELVNGRPMLNIL